jgi:hypothetical protein
MGNFNPNGTGNSLYNFDNAESRDNIGKRKYISYRKCLREVKNTYKTNEGIISLELLNNYSTQNGGDII